MIGNIFNIELLIDLELSPWIIDKNNPKEPLFKISINEYNLYKNGIFKKQDNKIEYNDITFWITDELNSKIDKYCDKYKINKNNIAISKREFIDKDILKKAKFNIKIDNILFLKNKDEDIILYKENPEYTLFEDKIEKELNKEGINITNTISIKNNIIEKYNFVIEKLIGYAIESNKFVDKEVVKYSKINYYNNDPHTLDMVNNVNKYIKSYLKHTDLNLRSQIEGYIKNNRLVFISNKINTNSLNKISSEETIISLDNIMKFENFKY